MINDNYVDQATAANILTVSRSRINKLCRDGRFDGAIKAGWSWLIPRVAVENFEREKRGAKPKGYNEKIILQAAIQEAANLKKK